MNDTGWRRSRSLPEWSSLIGSAVEGIDREWAGQGRDSRAFAEIAHGALGELCASSAFRGIDWIDELSRMGHWKRQLHDHTAFGEPAVTLARTELFGVDLYCWLTPPTAIHDHGFSGAFCAIDGSSLDVSFEFVEARPCEGVVRSGSLRRTKVELLRPFDARRIVGSSEMIHQVVHLASPMLSIAIRTCDDRHAETQRQYFPPGLAAPNPELMSVADRRKLQLIEFLVRSDDSRILERVAALVQGSTELFAFWAVLNFFRLTGHDLERTRELLARCGDVRYRWMSEIPACLVRQAEDSFDWRHMRSDGARLLAGLAAARVDCGIAIEIVEACGGGRSAPDLILEWIAALRHEAKRGAWLQQVQARIGEGPDLPVDGLHRAVWQRVLGAVPARQVREELSGSSETPRAIDDAIRAVREAVEANRLLRPFSESFVAATGA